MWIRQHWLSWAFPSAGKMIRFKRKRKKRSSNVITVSSRVQLDDPSLVPRTIQEIYIWNSAKETRHPLYTYRFRFRNNIKRFRSCWCFNDKIKDKQNDCLNIHKEISITIAAKREAHCGWPVGSLEASSHDIPVGHCYVPLRWACARRCWGVE